MQYIAALPFNKSRLVTSVDTCICSNIVSLQNQDPLCKCKEVGLSLFKLGSQLLTCFAPLQLDATMAPDFVVISSG